ncbi:hypothetical protein J4G08_17930 [Candidatus Poribacteria bacterium]|nr:hypothetical protein [Candidatus Poribacteria bacterium]
MKRFLTVSILVFLAVFIGNAYAPDVNKFKVCVVVGYEKEVKTEADIIESHLKRELRLLGDVTIVDEKDDWQWRIQIGILGHKYEDDTKAPGISIAASFHNRVPKSNFNNYNFWSIPVFTYGPKAANWSRGRLPSYCISSANQFDKYLEIDRKLR